MKKLKLLPTILMLVLCVGVLAIGIYAVTPTKNTISGSITINASNSPVSVELFIDGVSQGKPQDVRSIKEWPIKDLFFSTQNVNVIGEVPERVITLKIINKSTTQSLGVYFHTGELPTADDDSKGIKAGYASASNILVEDIVYDSEATNEQIENGSAEKVANVYLSPYSYIAKNDDKSDINTVFDVIEMDIVFEAAALYTSQKGNAFSYQLNIEPYLSNIATLGQGYIDYDDSNHPGTVFAGEFAKLAESITKIPACTFVGNNTIKHIVVPSSVKSFDAAVCTPGMENYSLAFNIHDLKSVSMCCDASLTFYNNDYGVAGTGLYAEYVKFNGATTLWEGIAYGVKNFEISNTIKSIDQNAFCNAIDLERLTIKKGLDLDTAFVFEDHEEYAGRIIDGWFTSLVGGTQVTEISANEYSTYTVYYPRITMIPYTLTLNLNGGNIDGSTADVTKIVTYTSPVGELPTPTRDGYTFVGWGYSSSSTTASYTEETTWNMTSNKTWYAVWTVNS